ncbi:hypothetical protein E6O75_ATG04262 [Venturia nashicola]|uniref:Uncharacterized protein n=1 Tax=Venturia nashicola TaxID=86259 RepID=A0A4Z1P7F0_9PEZI|nr:hypothetical protein E6O75_ATG04262 [Venturia nashicola]
MDPDQMVQADGVYVVAECRLPLSPTTVCRHKASSTAAVTTFGAMINLENTMQEAPSKRKSCLPRQQHQRLARRINWPASLAGSIGPPRSQASIGPASLAVEAHQVRAAKTVPASIQIRSSQLFVACPPRRPSVPVGETMCVWLVVAPSMSASGAQHVGHSAQHVGHSAQHVGHSAQHVGHSPQHVGHSAQHLGPIQVRLNSENCWF